MTQTDPVGHARSAADSVRIELAHSEADARAAVGALAKVWVSSDREAPLPSELVWVLAHSGNYVAVAKSDEGVVGATVGFRGVDPDGHHLHSHIAGVVPEWQGSGIGYLLKQHQRAWALGQGLDRITWTFDPLVARNAYFNVMKLGARLTDYFIDFYGPMDDGVNAGDETDRCLVTWRLNDPRAVAAAAGRFSRIDAAFLLGEPPVVLRTDTDGSPLVAPSTADRQVIQVPPDAVQLRQQNPALALSWRFALRQVLVTAFADGLEVVAVSRDGHYLLERSPT
jgi:predicted GNAT superfamily acetyltransferase